MSLSVKTRFEVFKRDRFTCSYCGKHPPEVLLEVDHIVPVAGGGSDDLGNLTTACLDCNRGKGGRALEEGTAPAVNRAALEEMRERVEQAQAYMEVLGSLAELTEQQVNRVNAAWAEAYGATVTEKDDGTVVWELGGYGNPRWPEETSIRRFVKKLGLAAVLDAVEITAAKIRHAGPDSVRYFYGVCHHSIREGHEPLSRQAPDESPTYAETQEAGHQRIGEILRNYQEHGYATLEDAVAALWPSDG